MPMLQYLARLSKALSLSVFVSVRIATVSISGSAICETSACADSQDDTQEPHYANSAAALDVHMVYGTLGSHS